MQRHSQVVLDRDAAPSHPGAVPSKQSQAPPPPPPLSLSWDAPGAGTALTRTREGPVEDQGGKSVQSSVDSGAESSGAEAGRHAEQRASVKQSQSPQTSTHKRARGNPAHSSLLTRDNPLADPTFAHAWSPAEDIALVKTVEVLSYGAVRQGAIDWARVLERLQGKKRTRRQVEGRWNALVQQVSEALSYLDDDVPVDEEPELEAQTPTSAIPWTSAEEARLAAAVRDYTLSRAARSGSSSDPHLTAHLHSPSSRDAWVAIKARFDASPDEAPRARSAASLAERWLHLEYTTGVHTTYRALAEAAIDHERAEWSRDEVGRLVGTVLALGGSAGRNAAGWEGEVEATSKWVQVWRAAGRGKTLVDVCLTWSEYRDVSRRAASVSPGASTASRAARSPTPNLARTELVERAPSVSPVRDPSPAPVPRPLLFAPPAPSPSSAPPTITSHGRTQPRKPQHGASGTIYTPEEDDTIRADRRAGVRQADTARKLGRTKASVKWRVGHLKGLGKLE
ncbi:hypothetical protein DMC30DRAFT_417680 [Rhodotorula diobovata]|uniref:Myb-like domain-containing protein n=1 Tax=Rhodotorula diobovata TaxID=5288 RepID=A0A5C5FSR7_9BASI|nr:hypothetical protein DMC30DRAFT_417680 [Rhodotorula diobovata]